jgi:hypothetical protein
MWAQPIMVTIRQVKIAVFRIGNLQFLQGVLKLRPGGGQIKHRRTAPVK